MGRRRIAFLFNHDQAHQVAHSLPIALDLIDRHADADVTVLAASDRIEAEIRRIAGDRFDRLNFTRMALKPRRLAAVIAAADRLVPVHKALMLADNAALLGSFDAIVAPDKTVLMLRTRLGVTGPRLIHSRHGAGDRAIGFNAESRLFDLVLVSGPKIRDRLIAQAGLSAEQIAVVGYVKFALWPRERPALPLPPGRPTVLYNPHPAPHLSSWYRWGPQILEFFRRDDRYNLIFAPHVALFQRRVVATIEPPRLHRPGSIAPEIRAAPNILVDTGSRRSIDMSYAAHADIYLGDASSQVYEFLHQPRPAVFANAHGVCWQGKPDYLHWTAGPVFDRIADLPGALDAAISRQDRWRPVQQRLLADTFATDDEPAPARAADAILRFLGQ